MMLVCCWLGFGGAPGVVLKGVFRGKRVIQRVVVVRAAPLLALS